MTEEPKRLDELAAEAVGVSGDAPAPCSRCGCTHAPGGVCRHCGTINQVTLQRQGAAAKAGESWACPRCKSKHAVRPSYQEWDVSNTYPLANGNTRRSRICRVCGQGSIKTEEVPVPDGHRVIVIKDTD